MRRADARFVLPRHPATATIVGDDRGWSVALADAGIPQVGDSDGPDLVVADDHHAADALAIGAPMVLIEGSRSVRAARSAGYEATRYLVLPDVEHPELVIPVAHRHALRSALRYRGARKSRLRRLAYQLTAAGAVALPTRMWSEAQLVLASRVGATPAALVEAERLGAPRDPSWYLVLGSSRSLATARLAFLAGQRSDRSPRWAIKVSRIRGSSEQFDRDEAGTRLLTTTAPALAGVAPRLLGRSSVADHHLSLETAAVGPRLTDSLPRLGPKAVQIVESIAAWMTELGVESRREAGSLLVERGDLAEELAPWRNDIDVDAILDGLRRTPAVLAHGDPGPWNMICTVDGFQVLDWEMATRSAPPLADLVSFLGDACSMMVRRPQDPDYLAALFSGTTDLSTLVFRQVTAAATALDLSPQEVGLLTTLVWLRRGSAGLAQYGNDHPLARFARRWIADPALGPDWSAWRPASPS